MKYTILAVALVLSFGIAWGATHPKLSAANAVQQAMQFIGGYPEYADVTGVIEVTPPDKYIIQGQWEIKSHAYRVTTDDTTGRVATFMALERPQKSEDNVNIDQEKANTEAKKVLTAAGYKIEDFDLTSSQMQNNIAEKGNARWQVDFTRVYQGYRFSGNGLKVSFDPEDGCLLAFGGNMSYDIPRELTVKVQEAEAEQAARQHMGGQGYQLGKKLSAELRILQPNGLWKSVKYADSPNTTRLAWTLAFDSPWERTLVYIDAATGKCLGGVHTSPKDLTNLPKVSPPAIH